MLLSVDEAITMQLTLDIYIDTIKANIPEESRKLTSLKKAEELKEKVSAFLREHKLG